MPTTNGEVPNQQELDRRCLYCRLPCNNEDTCEHCGFQAYIETYIQIYNEEEDEWITKPAHVMLTTKVRARLEEIKPNWDETNESHDELEETLRYNDELLTELSELAEEDRKNGVEAFLRPEGMQFYLHGI